MCFPHQLLVVFFLIIIILSFFLKYSKEMADNLIMGWTFYKKKPNTLKTGRLKFTDRNIEYLLSLHGDQNRLNIDIQCMAYIFKNSTL